VFIQEILEACHEPVSLQINGSLNKMDFEIGGLKGQRVIKRIRRLLGHEIGVKLEVSRKQFVERPLWVSSISEGGRMGAGGR